MSRCLLLTVLLAASLLYGCSGQSLKPGAAETAREAFREEPPATFEPDTFYDLMVAELGGQRQRYDLAVGNYLKQAHKTQDKGVAARAYQVASYIGAQQAALDAALLWSSLAPQSSEAARASALELMRTGASEQAVSRMSRALVLDPQADFEAMASYAEYADAVDDAGRNRLLNAFNSEIRRYPGNRSLRLGKAMLLYQLGRDNEALALTDKLLAKHPDSIRALIIKGRVLNKLGRDAEAERMLGDAVRRYPNRVRLRLIYARVLVQANKLDAAREQFEALLLLSPDDPEVILSLGLIAMDSSMEDEAEGYFSRLLSQGKKRNIASFQLGKLSERRGQWNRARQYYMSVTPGKEFIMSRVLLTQMLIKQEQWMEAREQLRESRILYPTYGENLYMLEGELLVKQGELQEARALMGEALARYPDSVNLRYSRAMILEKLDRIREMEVDLREILTRQPDNAVVINALGFTLVDRTSRLEEAEALIKKAYSLNDKDPAIIDSMGWLYYRQGNLGQAQKYLEQAYNQYPDAEVAAHLGEVYWMQGDKMRAREVWDKALKLQPDNKVLIETRRRLEKNTDSADGRKSKESKESKESTEGIAVTR